jgi:hypothetical protein
VVTQGDSVTWQDVELLRSLRASDRGPTSAQVEGLHTLADTLAEVVELPPEERARRLPQLLTMADVELLRDFAGAVKQSARDPTAPEGAASKHIVQQLDALALKLAAYLPPRNGG